MYYGISSSLPATKKKKKRRKIAIIFLYIYTQIQHPIYEKHLKHKTTINKYIFLYIYTDKEITEFIYYYYTKTNDEHK